MKIAISTIARNEINNVQGFVESCQDADIIAILDTGSTDGTIAELQKNQVYAGQKIIEPFDFAAARNAALDALPQDVDIVVSIDMDERLQPGWREALEKAWKPGTGAISYWYVAEWQDPAKKNPAVECWRSKIFDRHKYKWHNCVHEVPLPIGGEQLNMQMARGIVVHHYQTGQRNYIDLLTQLIAADPNNAPAYIQRGADYLKTGNYSRGVEDYERYIELARQERQKYQPSDITKIKLISGQIAHSCIEIARAKHKMRYPMQETLNWLLLAVAEAPDMREAWCYLAEYWNAAGNYAAAYSAAINAIAITESGIYAREAVCWGPFALQIAADCYALISQGINFSPEIKPGSQK